MYYYQNTVDNIFKNYGTYESMRPYILADWNINKKEILTDLDSVYIRSKMKPHTIELVEEFFKKFFSLKNIFIGSSITTNASNSCDFTLAKFNKEAANRLFNEMNSVYALYEIAYIHFYRGYTSHQVGFRFVYKRHEGLYAQSIIDKAKRLITIDSILEVL